MTATSWFMPEVETVSRMDGVQIVKLDMCAFGMVSKDEDGTGLVKKPTSMMTNSPEVGKRLNKQYFAISMYPRMKSIATCNSYAAERAMHRYTPVPFVERYVKE